MRSMKRETINIPEKKRKSPKLASRSLGFGVLAFCFGIIVSTVAKGMELDRKEAALRAFDEDEEENMDE